MMMKKAFSLLIGLALAQGATMAQTNVEVNLGAGVWSAVCTPLVVEEHLVWNPSVSMTDHLGVGLNTTFKSKLNLNLAANFHYMFGNSSYRTHLKCNYPDCDVCDENGDDGYKILWNEKNGIGGTKYVGSEESGTDYCMLAVPLKIGYRIGKFTPSVGVEYSYRMALEDNVDDLQSVGLTTGIRFDLNDYFAFSTDFYGGVTSDMSHKGTIYNCNYDCDDCEPEKMEIRKFDWRTYRIDFAIHYKIGGKSAK